jgi:hypothetical protein
MNPGGTTPTERHLVRLCRRSFLSLWSYPNLYRDAGRNQGKGDGNELCDLLVVFGDDIIIFSDKEIGFQADRPLDVAWKRWYRAAISESVKQLNGADSWITRYPTRIFLDKECRKPFDGRMLPKKPRVHRIAVASGCHDACQNFFSHQSTGSLLINTMYEGADAPGEPFRVGIVTGTKGFVHVFDEFALEAVFNEIDTISDFVSYITKRETFLGSRAVRSMATGEERLLSIYLTKLNAQQEHDFVLPGDARGKNFVLLPEGFWEDMISNPHYIGKKQADKISYAWDGLIEKIIKTHDPTAGTSTPEDAEERFTFERALRHMAAVPRVIRRQLAHDFDHIIRTTPLDASQVRVSYMRDAPGTAFVFLLVGQRLEESYEAYRRRRTLRLSQYCFVAKLKARQALAIVGIATEPWGAANRTEDLYVIDTSKWTDAEEVDALALQERTGLLTRSKMTYGRLREYPTMPVVSAANAKPSDKAQRKAKAKAQKKSRQRNRKT